jgi:hypothetical protein
MPGREPPDPLRHSRNMNFTETREQVKHRRQLERAMAHADGHRAGQAAEDALNDYWRELAAAQDEEAAAELVEWRAWHKVHGDQRRVVRVDFGDGADIEVEEAPDPADFWKKPSP